MREFVITNRTRDKKEEKGDMAKKTRHRVDKGSLLSQPGDGSLLRVTQRGRKAVQFLRKAPDGDGTGRKWHR